MVRPVSQSDLGFLFAFLYGGLAGLLYFSFYLLILTIHWEDF